MGNITPSERHILVSLLQSGNYNSMNNNNNSYNNYNDVNSNSSNSLNNQTLNSSRNNIHFQVSSYIDIVSHSIIVVLVISLLVLTVVEHVFRKRQPLKSRGISPYIALTAKLVGSLSVVLSESLSFYSRDLKCLSDFLLFTPLTVLFFATYCLQMFRYLVLKRLEISKTRFKNLMAVSEDEWTQVATESAFDVEDELEENDVESDQNDGSSPHKSKFENSHRHSDKEHFIDIPSDNRDLIIQNEQKVTEGSEERESRNGDQQNISDSKEIEWKKDHQCNDPVSQHTENCINKNDSSHTCLHEKDSHIGFRHSQEKNDTKEEENLPDRDDNKESNDKLSNDKQPNDKQSNEKQIIDKQSNEKQSNDKQFTDKQSIDMQSIGGNESPGLQRLRSHRTVTLPPSSNCEIDSHKSERRKGWFEKSIVCNLPLKTLSSNGLMAILLISATLFWIMSSAILHVIGRSFGLVNPSSVCEPLLEISSTAFFYIYVCTLCLLFVIFFVLDFISYAKLIFKGCGIKQIFLEDDPFYFRIEALVFFLIGIHAFAVPVIVAQIDYMFLFWMWPVRLARIIFFDFLLVIVSPGMALMVTLKWELESWKLAYESKQRMKERDSQLKRERDVNETTSHETTKKPHYIVDITVFDPSADTIVELMKLKETFELFKQFAKSEFSIENVLFYVDIQEYKKISKKRQKKRLKKVEQIYKAYLTADAVLEINLVQSCKEKVKNAIKQKKDNKISLENDLFDECENGVIANLLDIYSRFFKCSKFQQYISQKSEKSTV